MRGHCACRNVGPMTIEQPLPASATGASERVRAPRSLADDLRSRTAAQIARLLSERPDLMLPQPDSISEIATRAAGAGSIRRALHRLDRRALAVATALADAPRVDPQALGASVPLTGETAERDAAVRQALAVLAELALVWGDAERSFPVRALGPAVAALWATDLADDDANAPVPAVPVAPTARKCFDPTVVDRMAGQQGLLAVQTLRKVLHKLPGQALGLTREGVVAVRELSTAATALDLTDSALAMWLELGWSAGLLGPGADGEFVLPTAAGLLWADSPAAAAWALLVQTWWFSELDWDAFGRSGVERPHVFGGQHASSGLADTRHAYLRLLLEVPPGTPVDNAADVLADRRPLANRRRLEQALRSTRSQAEVLGITARGALSAVGRALLFDAAAPDPADPVPEELLVTAAEPLIPAEIDHVLVQGDLTIVAPGPLVPRLARDIAAFAEVESSGGATVFRITAGSIAAALDAGWDADRILTTLADASQTPIPQPVEYLVQDTERRHGRVRVGSAASFIVTSDVGSLDVLLAALEGVGVSVRRLSDTVAVSTRAAEAVVAAARRSGLTASAEDALSGVPGELAQGLSVAPPPRPTVVHTGADAGRVRAVAAIVVAAESPAAAVALPPAPHVPRMHPAQTQGVLAAALAAGGRVWLRHADNAGQDSTRLVEPLHLAGGVLEAIEVERSRPRRFATARLLGAAAAPSAADLGGQR